MTRCRGFVPLLGVMAWFAVAHSDDARECPGLVFHLDSATVLGHVPKAVFSSGVLYDRLVGPAGLLQRAAKLHATADAPGRVTMREFREFVFQLSKARLRAVVLPEYSEYLQACEDFCWAKEPSNPLLLMVADVEYDHFPDGVGSSTRLVGDSCQGYRLAQGAPGAPAARGRLFAASFQTPTTCSRLVTVYAATPGVFTNRSDSIVSHEVRLGGVELTLVVDGSAVVDLGESEGVRDVQVTSRHRSGAVSRAAFSLELRRTTEGAWNNTKVAGDSVSFIIGQRQTSR